MAKLFMTEIHRESHPISMCIPVMYLMTQYISCEFSHKCIASESTPLLEDYYSSDRTL